MTRRWYQILRDVTAARQDRRLSNERELIPWALCFGMRVREPGYHSRAARLKDRHIEWSDEPSVFAAKALSPAKVNQVDHDLENRRG